MRNLIRLVLLLCATVFALDLLSFITVEGWWFSALGFSALYWTQIITRVLLALTVGGTTAAVLGLNLFWAERWCSHRIGQKSKSARFELKLVPLLGALMFLGVGLTILLLWQWETAASLWSASRAVQGIVLPKLSLGYLAWTVGGCVLVIFWRRPLGWMTALFVSLTMGFLAAGQWTTVLEALHATPFPKADPIFGLNIGFYIFTLPLWELIQFWWIQGSLVALVLVLLTYLRSGDSLSEGYFAGFTPRQTQHLYGLLGNAMGAVALSFWLDRFALLYSTLGAIVGAGFADVHAALPARTSLSVGALFLALLFTQRCLFPSVNLRIPVKRLLVGYGVAVFLGLVGLPTLVQLALVQPNELQREKPYIAQSIQNTRQAFDLETIDVKPFNPKNQLTPAVIEANLPTIRNIRLWDNRPLLAANRQLQQFRPYYTFADADIDRYTFTSPPNSRPPVKSAPAEKRQVLIAARELDYSNVVAQAKTWVNRHLIYTHGYGFTLSPVNTAAPSGLPEYFVKDIGTSANPAELQAANPEIQASIPLQKPRIYFGEITRDYVLTQTTVPELDYPQGDKNAYNTYDGSGGVSIGAFWRRVLTACYLRDWQMLLTQNLTPKTQVLFRREIQARVKTIAPFLQFDRDPYLVAVQSGLPSRPSQAADAPDGIPDSTLFWIIDAYTVSNHYPYSDPGTESFNYIRNPVKVIVNAFNGSVTFYALDPSEPILATWSKIFKGFFLPIEAMPEQLRSHLRYPIDLFQAQSQSLLNYHMSDPQVFYNREDPWVVPNEIYGGKAQPVQPYYLIMKLPEGETEEFVLLYPFTPNSRSNLIAWLAARSDGKNYGKRLLYQFPKRELVFGPEQIEALINQDPTISQQISLWNRQGSRVLQGNLLIIPIEESLLYVEPIYLEAENNSVPTLTRVVAVYQDRVVMQPTLEQALTKLIGSPKSAPAPGATSPTVPSAPRASTALP